VFLCLAGGRGRLRDASLRRPVVDARVCRRAERPSGPRARRAERRRLEIGSASSTTRVRCAVCNSWVMLVLYSRVCCVLVVGLHADPCMRVRMRPHDRAAARYVRFDRVS
jgi:hypothetical protein